MPNISKAIVDALSFLTERGNDMRVTWIELMGYVILVWLVLEGGLKLLEQVVTP